MLRSSDPSPASGVSESSPILRSAIGTVTIGPVPIRCGTFHSAQLHKKAWCVGSNGDGIMNTSSGELHQEEYPVSIRSSDDQPSTKPRDKIRTRTEEAMVEEKSDIIFQRSKWKGAVCGSNWGIYNGNAIKILRDFPDRSVHCVITSPQICSKSATFALKLCTSRHN